MERMIARTLSGGKDGGADSGTIGVALALDVIVSDALMGPRRGVVSGRSSLGEDVLDPLRGAFIMILFERTPPSPIHVLARLHPPQLPAYPPKALAATDK